MAMAKASKIMGTPKIFNTALTSKLINGRAHAQYAPAGLQQPEPHRTIFLSPWDGVLLEVVNLKSCLIPFYLAVYPEIIQQI